MTKSSKSFPTWIKSVLVLFLICVVIGVLLPVLNDVLYVSPEERTSRAVKKIYGQEMTFTTELDFDANKDDLIDYGFGTVNKVYIVENDLLIQTTGKNGYKNGDITVWVKVVFDNGAAKIGKVLQESFTKQTLMSKLGASFYDGFLVDITDSYFTSDSSSSTGIKNPVSGATYSANAACNAVNAAIKYVNQR